MGRAARWFRSLLGLKKSTDASQRSPLLKEKSRCSFVSSHHKPPLSEKDHQATGVPHTVEISASDRVTGGGGHGREVIPARRMVCGRKFGLEAAAVVIQSAFRGYLARRALRALKGLVKLQALVRGYIVRKKRTAEWLSQMQALLRTQARARKDRAKISTSSRSNSNCYLFAQQLHGPVTPEKLEPMYGVKSTVRDRSPVLRKSGSISKLSQSCSDDRYVHRKFWDQRGASLGSGHSGENDSGNMILAVNCRDMRSGGNITPTTSCHLHRTSHSFTALKDSCKVLSAAYPVGFLCDDVEEEGEFLTANNSPKFGSASNQNSRRSPFTPSRSEDSGSYYGGYSYYPNYMSYTESSRAKARSVSAPKQRPQFEKSGTALRNGFGESRSASQKSSTVFTSFAKKDYPGSGRLDRYGMPSS